MDPLHKADTLFGIACGTLLLAWTIATEGEQTFVTMLAAGTLGWYSYNLRYF